jgi:hypothetical protein
MPRFVGCNFCLLFYQWFITALCNFPAKLVPASMSMWMLRNIMLEVNSNNKFTNDVLCCLFKFRLYIPLVILHQFQGFILYIMNACTWSMFLQSILEMVLNEMSFVFVLGM